MKETNLSTEVKKRVLVLDAKSVELASNLIPNCSYETITGNPLKPNNKYHFQYDYVFSFLMLQLAWYGDTGIVLKSWYKCLRPGGRIYIFVPSLEWVLKSYNIDNQPKHLWHHMYGWEKDRPHRTIFDMKLLRSECDRAGMIVTDAQSGHYANFIEGVEYPAGSHYISVYKPEKGEEIENG